MNETHTISGLVWTSVLLPAFISTSALGGVPGDPVMDGDSPNASHSGLHCWLRGDSLVNGAGVPADGTPVTSWGDLGSRGNDLTQTSGDANQHAVYSTDGINGHPALTFNGNDFLWTSSGDFGILTQSRTIFVVASTAAVNGGYVFDSSSGAGRNALFAGENANPTQWIAYPGGCCTWTCGEITADETVVVAMHLESGASSVYINGSHASDNDFDLANLAGFILGSRYNTANPLTGSISEVLIYDGALDSSNRELVEAYLLAKYLPGPPCEGDFDDSGDVDGADLTALLGAWGDCAGCPSDLDGNDVVDGADLAALLGAWGSCEG